MGDPRPIGIFDSGVGGLTVARAVMESLPAERVLYFADTARFPYGPRPQEEVRGFALEISRHLVDRGVKLVVMACNTATSAALLDVADLMPVPVIGVIEPAVRAALRATRNGRIGLIGTVGTVASGSYQRAFTHLQQDGRYEVISQACPRFVDFVERGDTTSPALLRTAEGYLALLRVAGVDTLILGCTHYPLLRATLQHVMGPHVVMVSSADETAKAVYEMLLQRDLLRDEPAPPEHHFESSGELGPFAALVTLFMGPQFGEAERVSLEAVRRVTWS